MLQQPFQSKEVAAPFGRLKLIASDKGLAAVLFPEASHMKYFSGLPLAENDNHPLLLRAEKQLGEYFAAKRKTFDLKLDLRGTVFQLMAWKELQNIPYGQTISYAEQAGRVGDAKKARAVGMANGRNPVSIIVPCHRVIGASGALTGYAGGMHVKEFLLKHEAQS